MSSPYRTRPAPPSPAPPAERDGATEGALAATLFAAAVSALRLGLGLAAPRPLGGSDAAALVALAAAAALARSLQARRAGR
jgi:hypothetical protein